MNFNDIYDRLIIANNVDDHNNIDIYDILQFNNLMELIIKHNKGTKEIFSQIITKIIEPYM